jgi:hypothetical protein
MLSLVPRLPARPRASRLCAAAVLSAALVLSQVARAEEGGAETRAAARELSVQGSELYEQGNFEQAYERFSRSYQLVQAPTVGLSAARSLLKLGRLVEASERFLDVQRQPLAEGAPPEHQKARADATLERQALLPRIPVLRVVLDGADPSDVSITLNGEPLPAPLLGVGRPVNPGTLAVKGTRGAEVVALNLELAEGETRDVTLAFKPLAPQPLVVTPPISGVPAPRPERSEPGAGQRTFAYIALGAGGAGLVVGSVFGLAGLTKKSDLEAACPDRSCPPSEFERLDSYETQRTVSIVGFTVGTVFAAAGVALLLTAPSAAPAQAGAAPARLALRLGPGTAELVGELP